MLKMSKSPFVLVLIAMMAAGNALPLWADSAKRSPELWHGPTQRNLELSTESPGPEVIDVDNCDLQARLAAVVAQRLAAQAHVAIAQASADALDALLVRIQAILADPNLSTAEQTEAIRLIGLEREQINYDTFLQNLAVDVALQVALALIELNRLLCKAAEQYRA